MQEYLLVDGYNIIHAWNNLKVLAEYNLEHARDTLVSILSNFQGTNPATIIIVFDAHKVKGGMQKTYETNDLFVVYTKEAETADNYIERVVTNIGKTHKVRVATSDALEQIIILSRGAIRVSARELNEEIKESEKNLKEKYIDNKPIKNNILLENLAPKEAKWLESLRRNRSDVN